MRAISQGKNEGKRARGHEGKRARGQEGKNHKLLISRSLKLISKGFSPAANRFKGF